MNNFVKYFSPIFGQKKSTRKIRGFFFQIFEISRLLVLAEFRHYRQGHSALPQHSEEFDLLPDRLLLTSPAPLLVCHLQVLLVQQV
jgi:hypothetical protein